MLHRKTDIFKRIMWYALIPEPREDGERVLMGAEQWVPMSVDRVKEIIALNKAGQKPEDAGALEFEDDEDELGYDDVVGQDSLTRMDRKKKKKKKKGGKDKERTENTAAPQGQRPAGNTGDNCQRGPQPPRPQQAAKKPVKVRDKVEEEISRHVSNRINVLINLVSKLSLHNNLVRISRSRSREGICRHVSSQHSSRHRLRKILLRKHRSLPISRLEEIVHRVRLLALTVTMYRKVQHRHLRHQRLRQIQHRLIVRPVKHRAATSNQQNRQMNQLNRTSCCRIAGIFGLLVILLFTACDSNRVFEENMKIADNKWAAAKPVVLQMNITDTVLPHNVYINIRNASHYPLAIFFCS